MRHDWDAQAYDSLYLPHIEWGRRVVGRLELRGDETVLEAGAGTGRDAQLALERIPDGRLIAVDGSADMLALLRERLASYGERIATVEADLMEPIPVDRPVDAIYSVATFHWIPDHDRLFANLAEAMRPAGQLVFDCGGEGNVAETMAAIAAVRGGETQPMNFRGIDETRRSLERAGFDAVDVRLRSQPASFADRNAMRFYIDKVGLGREALGMTPAEREAFADAVVAHIPDERIVYVRLEVEARRR
jgi:trans-aconitate 2-methyltransferase